MFSIGLFTACKKDEFVVDESSLYGTWRVANGDAVDNHAVRYVFKSDKSCVKNSNLVGQGRDTTMEWTYVVSHIHSIITMFDEKNQYQEQYRITDLGNREMHWENESPDDGNELKVRLIQE